MRIKDKLRVLAASELRAGVIGPPSNRLIRRGTFFFYSYAGDPRGQRLTGKYSGAISDGHAHCFSRG